MKNILVIGSLNMDLVIQCSRAVREGETLVGGALHYYSGGKGANQAVAARRLGACSAMAGRVGVDGFGDTLCRSLTDSGVDHSSVIRDSAAATGVGVISVFQNGNNSILVAPGANERITAADIDAWRTQIARADAVMLQLEIPWEATLRALELCREHGVRSMLDAGGVREFSNHLYPWVDAISPNQVEAELLTGVSVQNVEDAKRAAEILLKRGCRQVALKLGALGSLWADAEGMRFFSAYPIQAVDPTAAGDAFTAALVVQLCNGESIDEAMTLANATGALTASRPGAQPSIPDLSQVLEFRKRYS